MTAVNYKSARLAALVAACAALTFPASSQNAGPYTPEQVYFVLHDAIREALNVDLDTPQPVWVSLSTVGSIVEANDNAQVNDLANFCPPPSPALATFGREPKLDAVYDHVVNSIVSPQRSFSAQYAQARGVLMNADGTPTDRVKKYRDAEAKYVKAWVRYYYAKDGAERQIAFIEMRNAEEDWTAAGYRYEVDSARNITAGEEYRAGATRQQRRRDMLDAYRTNGLTGTDVMGAFVSPASRFSPEPAAWATTNGWVKVSFDSQTDMSRYSLEKSRKRGFGGLSLGFVSIGGKAGGNRTTETKVHQVHKLTYEFEIMRATIRRPWLDTTLLFDPFDWTWKKTVNTIDFPYVAVAKSVDGVPQNPTATLYDNKPVACAMLPLDAVVARKRKIVATVNKSDYQSIEQSGKASGGGSLFGVFGGGGSQNWSVHKVSEDGSMVTFSVEAEGIAVIGMVSQPLPQAPSPNLAEQWPANAWLLTPQPPAVPSGPASAH
jgi:hypothetical protein